MKKYILMIACLTTAGCNTTTSLNSYTDPAYTGKYHAKRIVVTSISVPLNEQQTFENSFVKAAEKYDVTILRGLQVFPPTRDFSNKDMLAIAKKAGGDSILIMSVDDRDVEETYVPATYHPGHPQLQLLDMEILPLSKHIKNLDI